MCTKLALKLYQNIEARTLFLQELFVRKKDISLNASLLTERKKNKYWNQGNWKKKPDEEDDGRKKNKACGSFLCLGATC